MKEKNKIVLGLFVLIALITIMFAPAKTTTITEATQALKEISVTPSKLDLVAAHCSEAFNSKFVKTASVVRHLAKPTSLNEATTQLQIIDTLGAITVDRINSLCTDGRQASTVAQVSVAKKVNGFFATNEDAVSVANELSLLYEIPNNQASLKDAVWARLQKKDCKLYRDGFTYLCK